MGLFESIKYGIKNSHIKKVIEEDQAKILNQLNRDAEEMSHDERIKKALNDFDQFFLQNEVSFITTRKKGSGYRPVPAPYDNSIFIYYIQPKPEPPKEKWGKSPEPPKPIDPSRLSFEDYGLYFNAVDACAFVYLLYCRYQSRSPYYKLDYGEKGSIEQAAYLAACSHYNGDWDDSSFIWHGKDTIYFKEE